VKSFTIKQVDLEIPDECLSPQVAESLSAGKYENSERAALGRYLLPDDRMVDLGAGAGFLCASAARVIGGDNVLGVEANPVMAKVAEANLRRNSGGSGRIMNGAVVADDFPEDHVRFLARKPFWGGHIDISDEPDNALHINVPVLRISEIMETHKPTLVMMDIEGGEANLAEYHWPEHVRLVILEIHIARYPAATMQAILNGFFNSGMNYLPWGSRGQILIFKRVDDLFG